MQTELIRRPKQRSLTLRIPKTSKRADPQSGARDRLPHRSHEDIFNAVADSPDRVESVMRDHLETVARQYWQGQTL